MPSIKPRETNFLPGHSILVKSLSLSLSFLLFSSKSVPLAQRYRATSLSLTRNVCLTLSLAHSQRLSLSHSLTRNVCFSHSLTRNICLTHSLTRNICFSHSLAHSQRLSRFVNVTGMDGWMERAIRERMRVFSRCTLEVSLV